VAAAAILLGIVGAGRAAKATAPAGRYVVTGGTVLDVMTKLTWQQIAPSQTFTWAGASTYCHGLNLNGGGWRLPSMRELVTIVDIRQIALMIDGTAFPGTPAQWFWSLTPALTPGDAWAVDFYSGGTAHAPASTSYYVRCVR
jgi:hypothetical protein